MTVGPRTTISPFSIVTWISGKGRPTVPERRVSGRFRDTTEGAFRQTVAFIDGKPPASRPRLRVKRNGRAADSNDSQPTSAPADLPPSTPSPTRLATRAQAPSPSPPTPPPRPLCAGQAKRLVGPANRWMHQQRAAGRYPQPAPAAAIAAEWTSNDPWRRPLSLLRGWSRSLEAVSQRAALLLAHRSCRR